MSIEDQQDAADRARMLEIMFQDSERVGPFRIAGIRNGFTNSSTIAILKDGDTSPEPDTFNTRQEAFNYCVQQIQAQSQFEEQQDTADQGNWVKVYRASSDTTDAINSIAEVLQYMGIDVFYDDEQATKDNVDLFIRLNHKDATDQPQPQADSGIA